MKKYLLVFVFLILSAQLFSQPFVYTKTFEDTTAVLRALIELKLDASDTTNLDKYTRAEIDSIIGLHYTASQVDSIFNLHYSQTEVDSLLALKYSITEIDSILNLHYTSSEVDSIFQLHYTKTQIDGIINLHYTKTETNNLLGAKTDTTTTNALDVRADSLRLAIDGNDIQIAGLETDVSNLQSNKLNIADSTDGYYTQKQVNTLLNAKADTNTTNALSLRVDSTATAIGTNDTEILAIQTKNGDQSDSLAIVYDSTTAQRTDIDQLRADVNSNDNDIADVNTRVDSTQGAVVTNDSDISAIQAKNSNQSDSISVTRDTTISHNTRLDNLRDNKLNASDTTKYVKNTALDTLETDVSNNTAAIQSNDTDISNIQTKNSNQSDSISVTRDTTIAHNTRLDNLQNNKLDKDVVGDSISTRMELLTQYADLSTALSSIGATETNLVINKNVVIESNTIIPSNINLKIEKGYMFSSLLGADTLIIKGSFEAGLYQIFDTTLTVNLDSARVAEVYPEYWGGESGIYKGNEWVSVAKSLSGTDGKILILTGNDYLSDRMISFVNMGSFTIKGGSIKVSGSAGEKTIYITRANSELNWDNWTAENISQSDFANDFSRDTNSVKVNSTADFTSWNRGDLILLRDTTYGDYGQQHRNGDVLEFDSIDVANNRLVFANPPKQTIYVNSAFLGCSRVPTVNKRLYVDNVHFSNTELRVSGFEDVFITNSTYNGGENTPINNSSTSYSAFYIAYSKNIFFNNIKVKFTNIGNGYGIITGVFLNTYINQYESVDNRHAFTTLERPAGAVRISNSSSRLTERAHTNSSFVSAAFDTHAGVNEFRLDNVSVYNHKGAVGLRGEYVRLDNVTAERCENLVTLDKSRKGENGKIVEIFNSKMINSENQTGAANIAAIATSGGYNSKIEIDGLEIEDALLYWNVGITDIDSFYVKNIRTNGSLFLLSGGQINNIYGNNIQQENAAYFIRYNSDSLSTPNLVIDNYRGTEIIDLVFIGSTVDIDTTTDFFGRFEFMNSSFRNINRFIRNQTIGNFHWINDWYFTNCTFNNIAIGFDSKGIYSPHVVFNGGYVYDSQLFTQDNIEGTGDITFTNMNFYSSAILELETDVTPSYNMTFTNNNFFVDLDAEALWFYDVNLMFSNNNIIIDNSTASYFIRTARTQGDITNNTFSTSRPIKFIFSQDATDTLYISGNNVRLGHNDARFLEINSLSVNNIYGLNLIESINPIQNSISGSLYYSHSNSGAWTTTNNGSVTDSVITVTHKMSFTPSITNISVTLTSTLGSATSYYISDITDTTFKINLNADPGQFVTGVWAIRN